MVSLMFLSFAVSLLFVLVLLVFVCRLVFVDCCSGGCKCLLSVFLAHWWL